MAQGQWNERDQQGWRGDQDRSRDDSDRSRYRSAAEDRSFGGRADGGQGAGGYDSGSRYAGGTDYDGPRGYDDGGRDRQMSGYDDAGYGRGGSGYGQRGYASQGRSGGQGYGGRQSYGGSRMGQSGRYGQGREDRSWWDQTKDEVSSWMGDDDAERRRRRDEMRAGHQGRGPKNYSRSDDRIREDVNDRLTDDPYVDASEIEVQVENGEVTLSGTVDSRDQKRRAEDCAEDVSGVKQVQNNVRVEQSQARQGSDAAAMGKKADGGSATSAGRSL